MADKNRTPSYQGLRPASTRASEAARGASKKSGTRCEVLLKRAMWCLGLRCSQAVTDLVGRPDFVFRRVRVAVFCDGDFWHGRNLAARVAKLADGHNAPYWVAKIRANVERDHRQTQELRQLGWTVLRFWESDIQADAEAIARLIASVVKQRLLEGSS